MRRTEDEDEEEDEEEGDDADEVEGDEEATGKTAGSKAAPGDDEEGEEEESSESGDEAPDGSEEEGEEESGSEDVEEQMDSAFADAMEEDAEEDSEEDEEEDEGDRSEEAEDDGEFAHLEFDPLVNDDDEDDLPFYFACPLTKEDLGKVLDGRAMKTQRKILHRVRVCHNSKVRAEKQALNAFRRATFEWIIEDARQATRTLRFLMPELMEMLADEPDDAVAYFREKLTLLQKKKPTLKNLVALELIGRLFPASDFRHVLTTPAHLLLGHWTLKLLDLEGTKVGGMRAVEAGKLKISALMLSVLYQYAAPAQRYNPAFWTLAGAVLLQVCQQLATRSEEAPAEKWLRKALAMVVALVEEALTGLAHKALKLVVATAVRAPADHCVTVLAKDAKAKKVVQDFVARLSSWSSRNKLSSLQLYWVKPMAIPSLEPRFHDPEDGPYNPNRENPESYERQKLKRQLKQEGRAAAKQLKRDSQFLQFVKAQERKKKKAGRAEQQKHVTRVLDESRHNFTHLKTENAMLDTSINPYTKVKQARKEARKAGTAMPKPLHAQKK